MTPMENPPPYIQTAGRANRTPQPWLTVFQNGYAPQLADSELILLRNGLANDDPRLIQGYTTYPPPLLCIQDWPCEKADAIGFTLLGDDREEGNGGEGITVGQVEAHFARLCYGCDRILGEPAVCRHFLNWWDETPKDVAYRNLIAALDGILEQRNAQAAVDSEMDEVCHCGQTYAEHITGGAGEHSFVAMPEYKPAEESNATCPLCNLPLDGEVGFHLACTKREQMAADLRP